MNDFIKYSLFIGQGLGITLLLLLGSLSIGLLFGAGLAIARYQKWAVGFIQHWVSVIRGTPVILQLSVVYFVFPSLLGLKLDVILAGILAFGLNSSAYMAEVFRAGIEGIPKGQFEAAKSLGITPFYMWKDIIFPQLLKAIWPALMNEVISLSKETALISMLGGMDLMRRAQVLSAEQFTYFLPLCIAGMYYYGLVVVIGVLGRRTSC